MHIEESSNSIGFMFHTYVFQLVMDFVSDLAQGLCFQVLFGSRCVKMGKRNVSREKATFPLKLPSVDRVASSSTAESSGASAAAVAIADITLGMDGRQHCENGARFNEPGTCDTCESVHLADLFEEIGLTGSSINKLEVFGCSSDQIRQILNNPYLSEITSASGSASSRAKTSSNLDGTVLPPDAVARLCCLRVEQAHAPQSGLNRGPQ